MRTLEMFDEYYQPDLRTAYASARPKPLKFGVGYAFDPHETCLILAKKSGGGGAMSSAPSYEVRRALPVR
jgi:hypothetical protein